ncbi:hypothetical protein LL999_22980 [Burkholderia ambifaria]|uniref:hypothetical protein n=1 Tax=Burkholderia ambifaria TaxID=152480 RepID=UPI001E433E66|nr:hypothetical protein [Burkholderia ambifaria]UEP23112.1 hypothetical protein LL999_22980 [Burkholderia ambifaria]
MQNDDAQDRQSYAAPSSTEPLQAISVGLTAEQAATQAAMAASLTNSQEPVEDPNVGVLAVAALSPVESGSVTLASTDGGSSQPVASSPAETLTFEQMVEQRFLQVEAFIVKLPYSIAHALHQGSGSVEELAQRAIAHLFGKDQ